MRVTEYKGVVKDWHTSYSLKQNVWSHSAKLCKMLCIYHMEMWHSL